MTNQRILSHFQESAELKMISAEVLADPIAQAIDLMFTALSNGNKILACGNGGSAADCQHFAAGFLRVHAAISIVWESWRYPGELR